MDAHCLVRGSINVDEYYYVSHISRPGETISSHGFQQRMGGKGFNQAVAVALATGGGSQGKVSFYGTVGDDDAGRGLKEKLHRVWGLNNEFLVLDPANATGRAIIQVADDGENSIGVAVLFPGANHSEKIEVEEKRWPPGATHVLLQNEISLKSTLKALDSAEKLTTIFNPSPMLSKKEIAEFPWQKVDWLIINQLEARSLLTSLKMGDVPGNAREILEELSQHPALRTTRIVCTLGPDGALASVPGVPMVFVPAGQLQGPVVDTTGAGDTFAGYFVAELMSLGRVGQQEVREPEITRLLEKATSAAAMCVERPGTVDSMPAAAEVERRFGGSRG